MLLLVTATVQRAPQAIALAVGAVAGGALITAQRIGEQAFLSTAV
jgi:hypothetical protein